MRPVLNIYPHLNILWGFVQQALLLHAEWVSNAGVILNPNGEGVKPCFVYR